MKKKTGINNGPIDRIDPEINTYLWLLMSERSAVQERLDHFMKYICDIYEMPPDWNILSDGTVTTPQIPVESHELELRAALGTAPNNRSDILQ